ncbi:unnamed protein product [Ranitomeya imitator]|uniref:Uncharacterized protein n=1 Tax=Ranitomeya imitator TaxID=111125 RepID=A0ABN9KRS0_9NEOB|nr:unnamed protein product [Ranitomeya imitator]
MDCDVKSDSSPEREAIDDDSKTAEIMDGMKKRKRKPYRPGIGGFMVRQRSRTGQGKSKRSLSRKDSSGSVSELLTGKEEAWNEPLPGTPIDECMPGCDTTEKIKKRYRKKKNKLEEIFPAYLQEAFFGRNLLDTSRQNKFGIENPSEEAATILYRVNLNSTFLDPSSDPLLSSAATPSKNAHAEMHHGRKRSMFIIFVESRQFHTHRHALENRLFTLNCKLMGNCYGPTAAETLRIRSVFRTI